MKKLLTVVAAAAIVAMAGSAMAAASANLSVTAIVDESCTVTGGTLNFGNLDPANPTLVTATSSGVQVACTSGTDYTLSTTANKGTAGNPGTLTFGSNVINYTISYTSTGTGTGVAVDVPIAGTIQASAYSMAAPGSYSDTIQINVSP